MLGLWWWWFHLNWIYFKTRVKSEIESYIHSEFYKYVYRYMNFIGFISSHWVVHVSSLHVEKYMTFHILSSSSLLLLQFVGIAEALKKKICWELYRLKQNSEDVEGNWISIQHCKVKSKETHSNLILCKTLWS